MAFSQLIISVCHMALLEDDYIVLSGCVHNYLEILLK